MTEQKISKDIESAKDAIAVYEENLEAAFLCNKETQSRELLRAAEAFIKIERLYTPMLKMATSPEHTRPDFLSKYELEIRNIGFVVKSARISLLLQSEHESKEAIDFLKNQNSKYLSFK